MRVAVLADIHGFNLALERVLEDIDKRAPFDDIVIAGDLCEIGPGPREVLEIVWDRGITAVQGNTDVDLVQAAIDGTDDRDLRYGVEQIGSEGTDYLANLPFSRRVTPPGSNGKKDDLLIVHANPSNMHDPIEPDLDEDDVRSLISDAKAAAFAFGHIHICYIREVDDMLLVDVSAVGNPKDGDLRCKYGILTWDPDARHWTAELVKLDYPLESTEAQIRASGLPKPEKVIRKLRQASYGKSDD
jgi:predicted phosphodiesterase